MRKLVLTVEDLSVESFVTRRQAPTRGTVVGAADTEQNCYSAIGTCPHPCLQTYRCDTSRAECLQTYDNTGVCC